MTIEQRSKAIYIYSLGFIIRLFGLAFLITSAFLQERTQQGNIYSQFNQYTIVYILGAILFLPPVIFDIITFFWINSSISDFKKRWWFKIKDKKYSPYNNYVFASLLLSILTAIFPIPWLNTIGRQRYIKNNFKAKQREKLITKIEKKYKLIDNYLLSKFFQREIVFYSLGMASAILIGVLAFLIDYYAFNNNPPLWFLVTFGPLFVILLIHAFWATIHFTSKRKQLMEYMNIKEIAVDDKLNKWIKTFSWLAGIAFVTNRVVGAARRYKKLDKSKEKASAAVTTLTLIVIFASIFLLFKIIKWQKEKQNNSLKK